MSSFTSDLDVRHLGPKHWASGNWELLRDLVYYIGEKGSCEKVTLKKGFITDGGSFKNILVPIIGSQTGKYFESYALHDGLARRKDLVKWSKSNAILSEALAVQGMSSIRRHWVRTGLLIGSPTKDPKLLQNAKDFVTLETVEIIKSASEGIAK